MGSVINDWIKIITGYFYTTVKLNTEKQMQTKIPAKTVQQLTN